MPTRSKKIIHVDRSFDNNPAMENVIRNLASAGLPNKEIAKLIGVRLATLERRIRTIPQIEEALIEGRSHATQIMVSEMYKTAIGGHVTQEIVESINAKGKKTTKIITRESPPNPHLMMYWLNNRDPINWKTHRQLTQQAKGNIDDGKTAESDKIARLSREVFESHTIEPPRKHTISKEASHSAGKRTVNERDVHFDVSGETADNLQDDVLDVPTEEGTESL